MSEPESDNNDDKEVKVLQMFVIKLMLIGDTSVGKTSIMFRFCDNTFSPIFINTIGTVINICHSKVVMCHR